MTKGTRLIGLAALGLALGACQPSHMPTRYEAPEMSVHPDGTINVRPESAIVEGGHRVRLHIAIKKPPGDGPFPVVVFNHGSVAGEPRNERDRRRVHTPGALVRFFITRGWMVAMPQRRGRGWSDGRYGEGVNARGTNYTCDAPPALAGARRGLDDIEAAMQLLKTRADVDRSRIVMAGQSRGGMLAIAYAGRHPGEVLGAVNFAGNWLNDECDTSNAVNKQILRMGSTFSERTLWLYGGRDEGQSTRQTRGIFRNFKHHGGKGRLAIYPDGDHYIIGYPWVWKEDLAEYMTSLGFREFETARQ